MTFWVSLVKDVILFCADEQALAAPAPADAATMQFLRQARQAYQFVPAIASGA